MKEFESTILDFHSNLWRYHFDVPHDIAKEFIDGDNKRVICHLSDDVIVRSALMSSKEYWFVLLKADLKKKLALNEGDKIQVQIEKDNSEYGHDMPEELQAILDIDNLFKGHFENLTPGKQRNLIYIVNRVKNTQSRLNKAMAIADHLEEVQGNLDFKLLNEKIKYHNNRSKLKAG